MGLDFGDLEPALEDESYPLTNEELLAAHGDGEIEHAGGTVSLASVLDTQDEQSYESADEVKQSVLNMVGDEAIGRKFYSDRESNDTQIGYEDESF